MINRPLRIASLNARSIFKGANLSVQKEFASYLSSPTLNFDILCIQELTAYHRQSSLTPQQIQSFKYLFPKATDYIVNKHCGIFCFNRNINLDNPIYQPDGRSIIATATAANTDTVICHLSSLSCWTKKRRMIASALCTSLKCCASSTFLCLSSLLLTSCSSKPTSPCLSMVGSAVPFPRSEAYAKEIPSLRCFSILILSLCFGISCLLGSSLVFVYLCA